MLMAYPGATLLAMSDRDFDAVEVEDTGHHELLKSFAHDPKAFVARLLDDGDPL